MQKYIRTQNELQNLPTDTPSDLSFNSTHQFMAVSAWDNSLRFYNYSTPPYTMKSQYLHDRPLLCCTFNPTNTHCYAGGGDGKLIIYDLYTGQAVHHQAHDGGIRYIKNMSNILVTVSFDKTIKFWDYRQPKPVHTLNLPDRIISFDCTNEMLFCCTPNNQLTSYELNNINTPKQHKSRLNWQIRSLKCNSDNDIVILGGIEGRIEVKSLNTPSKGYLFKICKTTTEVTSINCISMLPSNNDLISIGESDGTFTLINTNARTRSDILNFKSPVVVCKFSDDSKYLGIASGYDWSKGYEPTVLPNEIRIVNIDNTRI
ncbi:hypothetical protein CWI38_0002p0120 [Hamiltosporidium tvaerminnensis]|uniref:Uncharacterized protein n=1 Tax=Hamiltosporidium tvaerminnensis TaxID=1176355 RepID=A0A4Q9M4U1_9MICR|nr:hypothetical protein LUQ84_3485 [Hamiltosporidium tvaerminnensis]TBU02156.1 hypothetical protein CWI37_0541p0010 [Hamiltosporidium tvaerminnensis]TBU21028.1 hypothetical protein CWI38_0002p0120 [Hamiltosporidium tvaerminnensis]